MKKKTNKCEMENSNDEEVSLSENELNILSTELQQDRQYCTNKELLEEMYKWRNSSTNGLPIYKIYKNGKLVKTKTFDTLQVHEPYEEGQRYCIKYPVDHKRVSDWTKKLIKLEKKKEKGLLKKERITDKPIYIKQTNEFIIEDVTHIVEMDGWCFDIDDPLDPIHGRVMSEKFGRMIMMIAQRLSNHSYFRNYSTELKEDCQSYSYEKIIKGLFNYKFKYTNAFAYLTQSCFNSFKSILSKHYQQINIKRSVTKRAIDTLEYNLPGSSMSKSLFRQFEGNDYDNFSEF